MILFSAWFGEKYADSSRYEFEYLISHSNYDVFWVASTKVLYDELKYKAIPVLYSHSLLGWWKQARAIMLISSVQTSDFNNFLYRNCIFLDLDHGFSLKQVGFAIPNSDKLWKSYNMFLRKGMQYWMSAPTEWSMKIIEKCYEVPSNRIVRCNKPRTDILFDKKLQEGINVNIEKIIKGRRAIVWMPTHRSCGSVKIKVGDLIDLVELQKICEENNIVFIIKKHFYHKREIEDLSNFPNIFDVTDMDIDSTVILSQADALVSDYSASYIEYLALDRPILLYAYDKDVYLKNERSLYIKLEDNSAGEVIYNKNELLESIKRICNDWYDSEFASGRRAARDLYFDSSIKEGSYREHVKTIIDQMISGSYLPDWDEQ